MPGDFNIDILNKNVIFLIYGILSIRKTLSRNPHVTCRKFLKGSIIDLILIKKPRGFQKTSFYETGLSDCHKPTFTILKSTFKKLALKATKNGIMNSFWNKVKPFMTNKEILTDNKIVLNDVHLN